VFLVNAGAFGKLLFDGFNSRELGFEIIRNGFGKLVVSHS
jgi:hypothetical protein